MKHADTTFRLTLAALGTVALLGAAAAAGVERNTEMMNAGVSPSHLPTGHLQTGHLQTDHIQMGAVLTDGLAGVKAPDRIN